MFPVQRFALVSLVLALLPVAIPNADAGPPRPPPVTYDVHLATVPRHVYKSNDGLDAPGKTESWALNVLVQERRNQALEPASAIVEMYAGTTLVKTIQYSTAAIQAVRGASFKDPGPTAAPTARKFAPQDEVFDLRHAFSEPVDPAVDRMAYRLALRTPQGRALHAALDIPLTRYEQKTRLAFPLKGNFIVTNGHIHDRGHTEWSQHYAYDIVALGPHYELIKTDGARNEDFLGWGREVLAPAAGTVVHARNDVPDNRSPGTKDLEVFLALPDPRWAVAGNCVVIDHGHGEFSVLGHMQKGSIRVKEGDTVTQGQVLGLLGNSGSSVVPHLHYHLMSGSLLFESDGLPSRFDNLDVPRPTRGAFLEAR